MRRIEGTPYVDTEHVGRSIRATGRGRKGRYVHTCPDDVLQFIYRYLGEHGPTSQKGLKRAYRGPAMRVPIGLALLMKGGRVKVVGSEGRSPVFGRRGLLGRLFGR